MIQLSGKANLSRYISIHLLMMILNAFCRYYDSFAVSRDFLRIYAYNQFSSSFDEHILCFINHSCCGSYYWSIH